MGKQSCLGIPSVSFRLPFLIPEGLPNGIEVSLTPEKSDLLPDA